MNQRVSWVSLVCATHSRTLPSDAQGLWRRAVWPHRGEGLLHGEGRQHADQTGAGCRQLPSQDGHRAPRPEGNTDRALKRTTGAHCNKCIALWVSWLKDQLLWGVGFEPILFINVSSSLPQIKPDHFLFLCVPPARELAVLQPPGRVQDHDQRLRPVQDGGERWCHVHRLRHAWIRRWVPLSRRRPTRNCPGSSLGEWTNHLAEIIHLSGHSAVYTLKSLVSSCRRLKLSGIDAVWGRWENKTLLINSLDFFYLLEHLAGYVCLECYRSFT